MLIQALASMSCELSFESRASSYNLFVSMIFATNLASFLIEFEIVGSSQHCLKMSLTESTGLFCFDWWRRRDLFPVILRIVITTTLISRRTPRPWIYIPFILRAKDTKTIAASKKLNASSMKLPLEAKVFSVISTKKNVRKNRSMVWRIVGSMWKRGDMVRSKRMKMEYKPMSTRDKFSKY